MILFPGIEADEDEPTEHPTHRLTERYARMMEEDLMEIQKKQIEQAKVENKSVS